MENKGGRSKGLGGGGGSECMREPEGDWDEKKPLLLAVNNSGQWEDAIILLFHVSYFKI